MVVIAISRAFSSTWRMSCRFGSPSSIMRLLVGLYTPKPIVLPISL